MKVNRFTLFIAIVTLLCHSSAHARGEKNNDRSPLIETRYVETGPDIDGDPSDPVWDRAMPVSAFHQLGETGSPSTLTTLKTLYDDTSLFLLYICRGKPIEDLKASEIRRDASLSESDDDVEFFFYPGDQDSLYIHFSANPLGAKFDGQISGSDYYKDFTWTAAPGWLEDHWIMEFEIPLHQFVEGVKEGEIWKVNFARYLQADPVTVLTWAQMIETLYEYDKFGRLRFDKSTSFRAIPLETDWTADESRAIANLRKLHGRDLYQPIRDYLDVVLTLRTPKRPFDVLSGRVIHFIEEFPDSSASLELALRSIFPAGSGYRASPESIEALAAGIENAIDPQGRDRDLLDLAIGLFYNEIGQRDRWIDIYRELSVKEPQIGATAAYYMLSRIKADPSASGEEKNLLKDALTTFTDLAVTGSTPLHLKDGVNWLATTPSRTDIDIKFYNILKRTSSTMPGEILAFIDSLRNSSDLPDEVTLVLLQIEFEHYAERRSPNYNPQKADSLIRIIAPLDREYTQPRLNSLLRDRLRELDVVYSTMAGDSLPAAVRNAINLRKHLEGPHIVDMVFALFYETVDSLDKAVEYLENYQASLGKKWQNTGPVLRYLSEVTFRRDHRQDPEFYDIPRDTFRIIYRTQGFRKPSDAIDISSDGRAAIYAFIPDSLDPRRSLEITAPAHVDSPAVAFRLSSGEIDSLHALLSGYDFLRFRLKYTEPCNRCGNTEITLITPQNVRTIHLEGEDLAKAPFQLNQDISPILNKYLQSLYPFRSDWKGRLTYYTLWGEYNSPGTSPDERLDLLLDLFEKEPIKSSWQNEEWYIDPIIRLGKETGRQREVDAAIALRYFDSIFKWKSFVKERLPREETEDMARTRDYLEKASLRADKEIQREWFDFLSDFTRNFSGDLTELSGKIETLKDRENRENARSILIWLACARGNLDLASSIQNELLASKAGKKVKLESTLRVMLSNKDRGRSEKALDYARQIESDFRKVLPEGRDRPIMKLEQYSLVDLLLDKALLSFQVGDLEATEILVRSIDESSIPPDMTNEYNDLLRLVKYPEIPSTYNMFELSDYLHILTVSSHSGLHELNARWAIWLLENIDEPKLHSQVISMLRGSFRGREEWDELQKEMALTLLQDYRSDIAWKSGDLTEGILDKVIEYGDAGDVRKFWRDEILPQPMKTTRITALDRLSNYFRGKEEIDSYLEVLEKILSEVRQNSPDLPVSKLVEVKYTLDLAELYEVDFDRREDAIALVDSLAEHLPGLDADIYPYVFAAVAEWKAKHLGWNALVEFVRPHGESLIEFEKELEWSVYRPHFIPDTPLPSPILALRCIIQQKGIRRLDSDFFEILGITPDTADTVLKNLKISPRRQNLSCDQAQALNWKEGSFEALLEQYNRQVR